MNATIHELTVIDFQALIDEAEEQGDSFVAIRISNREALRYSTIMEVGDGLVITDNEWVWLGEVEEMTDETAGKHYIYASLM